MTRRIFLAVFLTALTVMLGSSVAAFFVFGYQAEVQYELSLEEVSESLRPGVESMGSAYLMQLPSDYEIRLTWIAANGDVLYDNRADVTMMENHGDREEILEALADGVGRATRQSGTLGVQTVYYATRLSDGSVLRLSGTQDAGRALIYGLIQPTLFILLGLLLLSALLSARVSSGIVRPINRINPEDPGCTPVYPELQPIVARLSEQNRRVRAQMSEILTRRTEFDTLTDHMSEGMIILNDRAEILSCNRSARLLFGLEDGEIPRNVLTLRGTDGFRAAVRASLSGENGYDTMEREGKYYSLLATPVLREGNVEGTVIMILDVTEKEERDRLRREFTANVSHELKTPLTSISGFAELIGNGLAGEEDVRRFAGNIYREARRLITLVGDIIRLSQMDGGEVSMDEEQIDLYAVARETVERLRNVAEDRQVTLTVEGEPVYVSGNYQLISLMIYNLAENGIQYNREGGQVHVRVRRTGKGAELQVADTGIGIPKEAQSRVFERFYRVDKSHSKEIGGTGLGLSIVTHAAACHGATVTLESEEGKGTVITLIFPLPGKEGAT